MRKEKSLQRHWAITWFGEGKLRVSTRHLDDGVQSCTEEGDAYDCRVVMGKIKSYCISQET